MLPSSITNIVQSRLVGKVVGGMYPEYILIMDGMTVTRWDLVNGKFRTDDSNNYVTGTNEYIEGELV